MNVRNTVAAGTAGLLTAAVAACGLWWWFSASPTVELDRRDPSPRPRHLDPTSGDAGVDLEGEHLAFNVQVRLMPWRGSWPRFRGADSDNISREDVFELADDWGTNGPPVLWKAALGDGYAAPAVQHGRVYVLDYDVEQKADALRCFSLDDGREIWRRWYTVPVKRNHGMSRTVPAVTDRYVVTIGPKCHVLCVDSATGAFRWGLDLVREFGAEVPLWYTGQCPLIDDGVAVLAPGGTALLIGVDCETGEVVWKTDNPDGWQMSHSSIMPATIHGKKQYVYCALGGIVAVSAIAEDRGSVLWKTDEWDHAVVAPSPVFLPGGRMLVTAGYGVGSRMFRINRDDDRWWAEVVATWPRTHFACEQQTPVFYRGRLFTIMPNDGGALNRQLVCMTPEGKHLWTSGKQERFGLGPFMVADDRLLVLSDDGILTVVDAAADRFEVLAQARVLDGREAWGPMALAEGRLLCRDSRHMVCLNMRRDKDE